MLDVCLAGRLLAKSVVVFGEDWDAFDDGDDALGDGGTFGASYARIVKLGLGSIPERGIYFML